MATTNHSTSNDLITAACLFLDRLELAVHSEEDLPTLRLLRVMRRIQAVLEQTIRRDWPAHALRATPSPKSRLEEFQAALEKIVKNGKPIFLDVQFVRAASGELMSKEFSACSRGSPPAWIMLKSPKNEVPAKKENAYLMRRFHGMSWDDGDVDEVELRNVNCIVMKGVNRVYYKGSDKAGPLRNLGIPGRALTELQSLLPRLKDLRQIHTSSSGYCPFHRNLEPEMVCSTKTAWLMMMEYYS